MKLTLVWNLKAFRQFEDAISYIETDSLLSPEKFETAILKKINELLLQPEKYNPDK